MINKNNNKQKLIKISDLGLVASLIASGAELADIEKDKRNEKYFDFCFIDNDLVNKMIQEYYKDKLYVSAKRVFQEYKTLKQIKLRDIEK